ncbi:MAG: phosphomannose isomerase type II C-terminal cupin domain [Synechococcus sp.]
MATTNRQTIRPWGWHEEVLQGHRYKLKRLWLNPGQRLSLQRHHHRSETWTVAEGHGSLLCNNTWSEASTGSTLHIPCGAVHRAKAGNQGLLLIEVQHGAVLSEDDIERLEDDYGRVLS